MDNSDGVTRAVVARLTGLRRRVERAANYWELWATGISCSDLKLPDGRPLFGDGTDDKSWVEGNDVSVYLAAADVFDDWRLNSEFLHVGCLMADGLLTFNGQSEVDGTDVFDPLPESVRDYVADAITGMIAALPIVVRPVSEINAYPMATVPALADPQVEGGGANRRPATDTEIAETKLVMDWEGNKPQYDNSRHEFAKQHGMTCDEFNRLQDRVRYRQAKTRK